MTYDPTAPVMTLVLEPGAEQAAMRPVQANDLSVMQGIVGGWLESYRIAEDAYLFMNEDGKMHGLPYNDLATRLCRAAGLVGDEIVGTVAVVGVAWSDDPEMGMVNVDAPESVRGLCARLGIAVADG